MDAKLVDSPLSTRPCARHPKMEKTNLVLVIQWGGKRMDLRPSLRDSCFSSSVPGEWLARGSHLERLHQGDVISGLRARTEMDRWGKGTGDSGLSAWQCGGGAGRRGRDASCRAAPLRSLWLPSVQLACLLPPPHSPEGLRSLLFQKLHLSEDVAGATFMAAGSSTPELFASVIGKKSRCPKTQDAERAQVWCPD